VAISKETVARAAKIERYRRRFPEFCAEQLWVKPKMPGPIRRFILNPAQQQLERVAQRQIAEEGWLRLVVLKARQQGISTWTSAHGIHLAALNDNIFDLVIAQDKETARHIFEVTKLFYDQLDEDTRPVIRYSSRQELTFENPDDRTRTKFPGRRSRITFVPATNIHAGTGQTIQALHLSEVAKYANAEVVTQSLFPAVPLAAGTSIIIESTGFPDSGGDWFHAFCNQAARGANGYKFVFLPWFISPEYWLPLKEDEKIALSPREKIIVREYDLKPEQMKFRRQKIEEWGGGGGGEDRFDIEFPSCPEDAWKTLETMAFDYREIYEARANVKAPMRRAEIHPGPRVMDDHQGRLWMWEEPSPGELYDIGIDVSSGSERGDWSVAEVLTRSRPHRQVAEWRGRIDPLDLGDVMVQLGYFYNTAQLSVEMEGIGMSTNSEIMRLGYPYIYIWRHRERAVPQLSSFSGWKTQQNTKPLMVALAKHLLMHKGFIVRSAILLKEMGSFSTVYLPGGGETWRAAAGSHDDCIMAFMIALITSEDEGFGMEDFDQKPVEKPKWVDPALVDTKGVSGRIGPREPFEILAETLKGIE